MDQPAFVFTGEYELGLDDKNRLVVPAAVRRCLVPERDGEGFVVKIGPNHKLWFYPDKFYHSMARVDDFDLAPDDDVMAFEQLHYAGTTTLVPDKQFRMLLPDKLLRRANLSKDLVLLGLRSRLELWNRNEWEQQYERLLPEMKQINLRARQARGRQQGSSL
jgi:MraZ protein